ncbi:uncharacterized protein BO88DRAFT_21256 [Aspergillus vadensis CBS 113365]|uniref:Uncharacterized protein n=1 Tax=Aspergillus vadensis (strain CBS 113365 / IMI 142717 / IBT 24658) TaxID=1448311 RepID=A0A319BTZ3_ASPVC|nr:hypothetical protein BO88DRAFT_21256 [Aspergillus vadensis CBS 113365]PYH74740.1 hypothetical protein BO88DRAFT_21256 [Aspergillus vadensis CBS 113365]
MTEVDLIYPNVEELMSGVYFVPTPTGIQPWYLRCSLLFRARGSYSPDTPLPRDPYRHHIPIFFDIAGEAINMITCQHYNFGLLQKCVRNACYYRVGSSVASQVPGQMRKDNQPRNPQPQMSNRSDTSHASFPASKCMHSKTCNVSEEMESGYAWRFIVQGIPVGTQP